MRTSPAYRRRGIAAQMLEFVIGEARLRGYKRMSLETGSMAFFDPARTLYARNGFRYCGPFADYGNDPDSSFMSRTL